MDRIDLTAQYGMPETLSVTAIGRVRVVTLNRPESLNAVNSELQLGLIAVWGAIAADPEARAVVLTGAGDAFSSGGDFQTFKNLLANPELVAPDIDNAGRLISELLRFPLPVVTAVNGAAVGLGSALASLSDIVLMSDRAYLQDPHVAVGLVAADGGSLTWPFLTSILKAKEHILLGTKIKAELAVELGLANRVVAHENLEEQALDLAERLAALPPQAVQETKKALNQHLEVMSKPVLDIALEGEKASFNTPEFRAIVERFLTKA